MDSLATIRDQVRLGQFLNITNLFPRSCAIKCIYLPKVLLAIQHTELLLLQIMGDLSLNAIIELSILNCWHLYECNQYFHN